MRISVNAGPSVGAGVTRVPFFVRVIDANGAVVQGSDQLADYKLSARPARAALRKRRWRSRLPYSN